MIYIPNCKSVGIIQGSEKLPSPVKGVSNSIQDTIEELDTTLTASCGFSVPWQIPSNINTGMYTVKISDAVNSNSVEIFIE